MIPSIHDEETLLQAYADGELDPVTSADFERSLASDTALRARLETILSLRRLVRTVSDNDVPLERLRTKVEVAVNSLDAEKRGSWRALAAAALIGAVISGATTFLVTQPNRVDEVSNFVVANHVRSLLAAQPFDVASSDRHTIKPWFTTKLPESPPVIDLSGDGFVLAGGRVDVVVRDPVATIVYRHGQHVISLTTLRGAQLATLGNISGYNIKTWREGDFTYIAVSDLPVIDLDDFQRAFTSGLRR